MNKWVKWIGRIILGLFLLLLVLLLSIHTAPVKRFIRNKLQAYLSSKIKTEVYIASIDYRLPKWVELDGVFLRDEKGDTLLYGNRVRVDVNMLKLLKGKYEISKVLLESVTANISRTAKDSSFNFQFIANAFAGKKTDTVKKSSPVSLSLDEISVKNSSFRFNDLYGGTIISTRIGDLSVLMDSIDINTLHFAIDKCTMADLGFDMHLLKNKIVKKVDTLIATTNSIPIVKLGRLSVLRSHFAFNGEELGINTTNEIGEMNLDQLATNAPMKITLDKLELKRSSLLVNRSNVPAVITAKPIRKNNTRDTSAGNLVLAVKQVSLSGNTVLYNDLSKKTTNKGFDAGHIGVHSLNAEVSGITYKGNDLAMIVKALSLSEKSGFIVNELHGDLAMTDSVIKLKSVVVKTPGSHINGNLEIYPATLNEQYHGRIRNTIEFSNNTISLKDINLLAPSALDKYRSQLQGIAFVYVNAYLDGNAAEMTIKNITLHSDKNDVYVNASGSIYNAFSKNNLKYNLSLARVTATKGFLEPFINTNGKQTVDLPPLVNVKGKIQGNMIDLNTDLTITSNYGIAFIKGGLKNFTKPDKLRYDMRLLAKDLETGKWIHKDSLMGKLNGTIIIKGAGIDYKTADINSLVDINYFRLRDHTYTGIKIKLDGTAGTYDIKGGIADSLVRMNMDVHTSLSGKYPTALGKVVINNADLYALGLYKTPFKLRTAADIQVKDLSPGSLDAFLRLDSTVIHRGEQTLRSDSFIVKGSRDSGKTLITLRSPMADATVKGNYQYDQLGAIVTEYMHKYSKDKNAAGQVKGEDAGFELAVDLKPDPVYALLLPGLFFDKNIHATGKLDTKQKDSSIVFYLTAPSLTYGTNHIANLRANINGLNDSIKYAILLDTVRSSSLLLYTTSLSGGYSNDHLSASLVTRDDKKKDKYALALTAAIDNSTYTIHMEDKLKLNYSDWVVDKQNKISYSNQGINISSFKLSKNTESISINSSTTTPNAPLDINISNFSLYNITGLLNRDSLEVAGMLNAQVKVDGLDKSVPLFNGTVKVDSLAYQNEPVGNIQLTAQNTGAEAVTLDGNLSGKGNNVHLKGTYDQSKIDAQLTLDPIQFAAIEPFTQHNLTRSSGRITGNISVTGDVKDPQWNGTVSFDSAFTQLAKYGTVLKLSGQKIDVKYPVITFSRFTIKDSLDHNFIIDGKLEKTSGGFNTNLTVKAKNFTALDNSPVTNGEIYGKAIVDVDVTVVGNITTPDINGNLSLKDKSQVTFVRQEHIASAKDREGVIEFVDMDTIRNKLAGHSDTLKTAIAIAPAALNYNLNIDIDKNAKFIVIIDPITRDELQVQGAGQLNAGVNPNGDISITGAYNLSKGSYQLNNKFLKRKFQLQEGSTIVLSGDPKNAEANITAIYDIEASPYDLVSNEVSDYAANDNNLYKQKIPFQVILRIKGKVIEPTLEFDVQLKENTSGINYDMINTIDNKLVQMRADASTMNKQVFALLVMGRFIGEQSQDFFAGSNGDGLKADQVVKESVSRFLSDAVSQVASDLMKGVDVDINLRTVDDYSTAQQRTDLNIGLSKRFLNDRLGITVGKSFTVDGEDPLAKGQDNANVQFLPDITTTYKLSKDGRYMLKAYQKNEYEAILDGYFIETGVAFTLTMDYNKFKELFAKKKKKDKKDKQDQKGK